GVISSSPPCGEAGRGDPHAPLDPTIRAMSRLSAVFPILLILALAPISALADTDLRALLAVARGQNWIEASASPTVLDGPFTVTSYVNNIVALGGKPGSAGVDLALDGFTRGYARQW